MSDLFDSTKHPLSRILEHITEGKIQLPEFQRGWIWDDDHIRSLLVSIARDFPIGSIMLLETGGEAKFLAHPVEGVSLRDGSNLAEQLVLDGQQRLTALTQVLKYERPVKTSNDKKRAVERYYYFSIESALGGGSAIEDALIAVDGTRVLRSNFGRNVELDLTTPEKEYETFHFPCNQILNSDRWEEGLMAYDSSRFQRYMLFRKDVLSKFREYLLPVIELKKEYKREAVCVVFDKVNSGGVKLSNFELLTATYAADGFNLREDWYGNPERGIPGRKSTLAVRPLLGGIEPTDFLQGISLLYSYDMHVKDIASGKVGKEITAVSAKREHVLAMPLAAYQAWADKLTGGFGETDRFLRQEGFHKPDFLPYRTQLIPLAAAMVHLGVRWLEPQPKDKIRRWFWSGVLGELYGGAGETRIASDLNDLLAWISQPSAPEPKTVNDAGFQTSRLDTLRTRTSAAYRGLYVLLQREGAQDFFWKARMIDLDRDDCMIDIHHIFPKDWCERLRIAPSVFNSIVNKTAISYLANRMIQAKAPSVYLKEIRENPAVKISDEEQDAILRTHLIEPEHLRKDDFERFYAERKKALLRLVEGAMGKSPIGDAMEPVAEDDAEETTTAEQ